MTNEEFLPVPNNMEGALKYAEVLAKSQLVPKIFQGKPADIVVAMMWSHTLGIPVLQGLQGICIVNGRAALWGDLLLAVCQKSGQLDDISETLTGKSPNIIATCTIKRKGRKSPIIRSFSIEDARAADLLTRDTYRKFPKRMIQLRARSMALRDAFPDVLMGLSSADEEDYSSNLRSSSVEMGSAEQVDMPVRKSQSAPQLTQDTHPEAEVLEAVEEKEVVPVAAETVSVGSEEIIDQEAEPTVQDIEAIRAEIYTAENRDELLAIWKSLPKGIKGQLVSDFTAASNELFKAQQEGPDDNEPEKERVNEQPQPAF